MSNIEKKLRKRGMQKLDKFAKNPYKMQKAPSIKRVPAWFKITVPAVSCALALSIAVIIMLPNFAPKGAKGSHNKGAENQEPSENGKAASEAAVSSTPTMMGEDDWNSLSFVKQYSKVYYDNNEYEAMESYPYSNKYPLVKMKDIETKIGTTHVTRRYESDGVLHERDVDIYKIKNISTDAYICINNYVYWNRDNVFDNVGDFLNQYSFDTEVNLRFVTVTMIPGTESTTHRESATKEVIKSYIFSDTTIANDTSNIAGTEYSTGPAIRITLSVPIIGLESVDITVYSSGVLELITEKNHFNIGVTAYQGLYDYIISLVSQFSIIIYK